MSFFEGMLLGQRIAAVHTDSEVTYLILADGTQVTIHGVVVVEPPRERSSHAIAAGA